MNQKHLSLTEAQKYTGKSRSSLRRFVESIVKVEDHDDRGLILPTISKVDKLKADRHPFSWKISTELLDREFLSAQQDSQAGDSNKSSAGLVTVLNKTINTLEKELVEKNKQIAEFQDRQKEFNFLLGTKFENVAIDGNKVDVHDGQVVSQEFEGDAKSDKSKKRRSFWKFLTSPINII